MVKKLYSSVASVLLISMLAVNLQSFAIIESAVNDSVDLSQYFNYDIVKNTTDKMDREYGDKSLMYSREANLIADDMTVTLGEKVFQLNLEYDGADVIKVDETIGTVTVEFPEMYVKSVDLVISSENGSGETDIVLNYNDADKTTASDTLKVYQMTDSTEGFSMGLSMIRYDSRYIKKFVEGTQEVYLHMSRAKFEKIAKANSITFNTADFDYHILAMNINRFSDEEIAQEAIGNIEQYKEKYKDKTVIDIKEEDLDELADFLTALINAKNVGAIEDSDELIELITYLYEGSKLYLQQKKIWNERELLLGENDYLSKQESDITRDDIAALEELIEVYEKSETIDIDYLREALEYFENDFDLEIDYTQKELLQDYLNIAKKLQEQYDLKLDIDEIYNIYENKETVSDADEAKLKELLDLFDEAEAKDCDLSGYNVQKITKLYMSIKEIDTQEGYIDLTPYFNSDTMGQIGDKIDIKTWFGGMYNSVLNEGLSSKHYTFGRPYSDETFTVKGTDAIKDYKNGYVSLTNNGRVQQDFVENIDTDINKISFKMYFDTDTFAGGINDTIFLRGDVNNDYTYAATSVTISLSGINTSKLFFAAIAYGSDSMLNYTLNYADGTSETDSVTVVTQDRVSRGDVNDVIAFWFGRGQSFVAPLYNESEGEYKLKKEDSGNIMHMGIYGILPDTTKALSSITFTQPVYDVGIFAMTEQYSVDNEYMLSYISDNAQYVCSIIENGNAAQSDLPMLRTVYKYIKALNSRYVYTQDIISDEVAQKIELMMLEVKANAYRYDKISSVIELSFNNPVNTGNLSSLVTISNNGTKVTNYVISTDKDGKSAKITVNDNGAAVTYSITLSEQLSLKEYPNIKLDKEMQIDLNVDDYLTAAYSGKKFTVINNSKVSESFSAYVSAVKDGTVVKSKGISAVSEAESSVTAEVDMSSYSDMDLKAYLWDKNQKPLYKLSAYEKTTAKTDNTADYKKPVFDIGTLSIKGFTPNRGEDKRVTLLVKNDTETVYACGVATNSDGYFEFNIKLSDTAVMESGYLDLSIGGDDFDAPVILENAVFYALSSDVEELISKISAETEIGKMVELIEKSKTLLSTDFPVMKVIDLEKLAEKIVVIREEFDVNYPAAASKTIKCEAILEALREGNKMSVLYSDGTLLYEDITGYADIDKDGVTLWKIYNSDITDEGKKKINSALDGKDFKDIKELNDELVKLIMLRALTDHVSGGTGYIENALTASNAKRVSMDITKYTATKNKTNINNGIFKLTISSLSDVESYISNWKEPVSGGSSGSSSGGSSSGVGGSSQAVVVAAPSYSSDDNNTTSEFFSDMDKTHWAYDEINHMSDINVISGYEDNTFGPDKAVTRAEFVTMLCKIQKCDLSDTDSKFDDVNNTAWYKDYVMTAYENGWINGVGNSDFSPESSITRQDMCVIIYRILGVDKTGSAEFSDKEKISDYAYNAVAYLNESGIINGFEDNSFRPDTICTRAQAASILYRFLTMQNK